VARGSSPESPGQRVRMTFSVYCIALLFYYVFCVVSCPYMIYHPTVMAQYILFVLKVPLNPKQANKQNVHRWVFELVVITSFTVAWTSVWLQPCPCGLVPLSLKAGPLCKLNTCRSLPLSLLLLLLLVLFYGHIFPETAPC